MTKYLIINADDYGLTPQVSVAIRKAHWEGILTSTTVMMNLPDIEGELNIVLKECPNLGLGVHLNITDGYPPLLSPERLPSLMSLSDGTVFPDNTTLRANLEKLSLLEVEAEWRAQIERFVKLVGRNPDHLDSHYHDSFMSMGTVEVMLRLANEFQCAVRMLPDPQRLWLPHLNVTAPPPDFFCGRFLRPRRFACQLAENYRRIAGWRNRSDESSRPA